MRRAWPFRCLEATKAQKKGQVNKSGIPNRTIPAPGEGGLEAEILDLDAERFEAVAHGERKRPVWLGQLIPCIPFLRMGLNKTSSTPAPMATVPTWVKTSV